MSQALSADKDPLPSWSLADLYTSQDAPEVNRDLDQLKRDVPLFIDKYRGKLAKLSPDELALAIKDYEKLASLMGRLGSFAFLQFAADSSDPGIVTFRTNTSELLTRLSSDLVFFGLELNELEEYHIEQACLKSPSLAHYRPFLRDQRFQKPYQLNEDVEKAFTEAASVGTSAWNRLFDETMASMTCDVAGQETPLGLEETLHLMLSPRRTLRQAASEGLSKALHEKEKLFTFIINIIAKDNEIHSRWRNYPDLASAMHLHNRVEPEVVEALTTAVNAAYPRLSHRYYKLKAGWLGLDKLSHWDRNAPLPITPDDKINWQDAKALVLEAYEGFSPQMAEIARRFFTDNWIDAASRKGKTPGAFSASTVPEVHPYILMNYQGSERDVMTLAHELGHGIHQVLSAPQGALMSDTPLTLAETASVFGEKLVFNALLARKTDERERLALIASKVEDMLNTVVRQIAFYQFERALHEQRKSGELTTQAINALWLDVQSKSLGSHVHLGTGYEIFWAYIPHFIHSPFYVYSYAFGDCLVNALYGLYEDEPEGFSDKYLDLMRAGGTRLHGEALAAFNLDASDPNFWSRGLNLIESMIDSLEAADPQLMKAPY